MSFQNRMVIPAANGLSTLSIPLVGGRENNAILRDVRIDNSQRWQVRHWRTLTSAYRRSPWFEFYEPELKAFYHLPYEFLHEWNLDILKWVLRILRFEGDLIVLQEPMAGNWPNDHGKIVRPANFQEPPFSEGLPVYAQVFQDRLGFQRNVSIADLIFNEGNKSRSLIA